MEATLSRLALEYLVRAYSSDKLNDPAKAEALILKRIQLDPTEISNYFLIAKVYEDVGESTAAENALLNARDRRPDDPTVYLTLAGFYNRQGAFDKTIAALIERADRDAVNPEAAYTVATYYWDKAYRDFTLPAVEAREMVVKGLEWVQRAIGLKPNYVEALVYKNLLLRLQLSGTRPAEARSPDSRGRRRARLCSATSPTVSAEAINHGCPRSVLTSRATAGSR
jgi:tetratricopeptide (TPR) repeat protein